MKELEFNVLRDLKNEDKSLITSIISKRLFNIMGEYHRKKKVNTFFERDEDLGNLPSKVWLVIDEAHVVAPKDSYSPARSALVEYVKGEMLVYHWYWLLNNPLRWMIKF